MSEEFFIGWQGKAPEKTGKFLKRRVVMALVAVLAIGAGSAALQGTIGKGRFDFGNVQEFKGVLVRDPVPTLLGDDGVYYTLVNEWKYGFPMEEAEKWHLKPVVVKGTWIGDGVESMIEVVEGGVSAGEGEADGAAGRVGKPHELGYAHVNLEASLRTNREPHAERQPPRPASPAAEAPPRAGQARQAGSAPERRHCGS